MARALLAAALLCALASPVVAARHRTVCVAVTIELILALGQPGAADLGFWARASQKLSAEGYAPVNSVGTPGERASHRLNIQWELRA